MDLTAIILAAGLGSRLRPLTDETPKPLLDVGGRTILARQLERIAAAGIPRAVVVTGYRAEQVEEHLRHHPPPIEVRLAPNPLYATTGNCMSVLAAREHCAGRGIVICDGDVVLSGDALVRLVADADVFRTMLNSAQSYIKRAGDAVALDPRRQHLAHGGPADGGGLGDFGAAFAPRQEVGGNQGHGEGNGEADDDLLAHGVPVSVR